MPTANCFYKPERSVFCGDGREQELLAYVRSHPRFPWMQDNPREVLSAIDEFGHEKDFLMNVGEHKGAIVVQTILDSRPRVMVELGGYVGYSAILFGQAVRSAGGKKYISLELNREFASVASSLISIAGLEDFIDVVVGPCASSLEHLHRDAPDLQIDLLFLDHQKSSYVRDLVLCEELSLIRQGSTVVADNVISPGAPHYLDYIRGSRSQRHQLLQSLGINNGLLTSNMNLSYDSKLHHSFEPTGEPDGVEVSVCE